MRICLDTSGYAAFKLGHDGTLALVQRAAEIVLPAVVLGELLAGFRIGGRDRSTRQELNAFMDSPRVRVMPLDFDTAERYAEIVLYLRELGTPIPTSDIWIAATAMQWGLRILTTDAHFSRLPQVSVLPLE